ncbi:hypothetical protein AAG570_001531 [Ranatra chinensis]|uniref:Uncharacterized protein n=1 Tax=Ranatra chinensis TaxID=642074 RepID=A0ABD0YVC5_9HEMI
MKQVGFRPHNNLFEEFEVPAAHQIRSDLISQYVPPLMLVLLATKSTDNLSQKSSALRVSATLFERSKPFVNKLTLRYLKPISLHGLMPNLGRGFATQSEEPDGRTNPESEAGGARRVNISQQPTRRGDVSNELLPQGQLTCGDEMNPSTTVFLLLLAVLVAVEAIQQHHHHKQEHHHQQPAPDKKGHGDTSIFVVPDNCPQGQKRDETGACREVFLTRGTEPTPRRTEETLPSPQTTKPSTAKGRQGLYRKSSSEEPGNCPPDKLTITVRAVDSPNGRKKQKTSIRKHLLCKLPHKKIGDFLVDCQHVSLYPASDLTRPHRQQLFSLTIITTRAGLQELPQTCSLD